jgi:hypothetical protein
MRYIKYLGEDLVIPENGLPEYAGKIALYKDKVYKLEFDWDGKMDINGYWIFYIFDELGGDSHGYEIKVNDIQLLRDYNISEILK